MRLKTGSEMLQEALNKAKLPSELMKEREEAKDGWLDDHIKEIDITPKNDLC